MQAVTRLSSASRRASIGISKEAFKSKIEIRGKSHVSSVTDESLKSKKVYKRIPKQERRSMVVSFVDKYRALNGGKFPGPFIVQQELGGSYYVIREIIQELVCNHKNFQEKGLDITVSRSLPEKEGIDSAKINADSEAKRVEKERASIRVEDVNVISGETEGKDCNLGVSIGDMAKEKTSRVSDKKVENFSSVKIEEVKEEGGKEVNLSSAEILKESPAKVEPIVRDQFANSDRPQGEFKSEKKYVKEESSETTGKLWGNLKSLANGFVNFWKNF